MSILGFLVDGFLPVYRQGPQRALPLQRVARVALYCLRRHCIGRLFSAFAEEVYARSGRFAVARRLPLRDVRSPRP
jgi:hypothetical protein